MKFNLGRKRPQPALGQKAASTGAGTTTTRAAGTKLDAEHNYLPFPASIEETITYLHQVVEQGGEAARQYKNLSYELLQLALGMQVLDVGCGPGIDLLSLADRVGPQGRVIGLDHSPAQLHTAREAIAGRDNVQLVEGKAEQLPFDTDQFHRVRADRVLQHIEEPAQALAEMWRVLQPGGILTLIEPDWKIIAIFPGSPAGGDDDHTLNTVLAYNQRHFKHALIGRQLFSLLHQQGKQAWEHAQIQVVAYPFTSWSVTSTVLALTQSAQALAEEEPMLADDISAWLQAVGEADARGNFLAIIPLFFASARKKPQSI